MYRTFSVSRFFGLLLMDVFIFLICSAFFWAGKVFLTSAVKEKEEQVSLPVIMYHSIHSGSPSEYAVTPEQLESDLRWLSDNGCHTVTAQQVIDYTRGIGKLPEKSVMITLDDGYYNNLVYLLPLLEEYDMTALISTVGTYTDVDAVRDPHIPAYSYLTWEDIRTLSDSGRIEFGNHTYAMHSLYGGRKGCTRMDGEDESDYRAVFSEDLSKLQEEYRENLGTEPVVFAYPFGSMSRESLPVIREQGFLMTLTCRERPNIITRDPGCLYGIGRYNRSGLYSTEAYMREIFGADSE